MMLGLGLLLLVLLAGAMAAPTSNPLLRHPDDARRMSWAQLDQLFRGGTIEGGIPSGYTYGYCIVNLAFPGWQGLADAYWHGKHFQVLFQGGPEEDCTAGAAAGIKGCGGPRGVVTNYLSLWPQDQRIYYQEMPGLVYIGHLRDIHPPLEALQLDEKPSIIVDYRNQGGGDEIRLINADQGIYLGRGTDWSAEYPHVFAYFVLQLSDIPLANEINWVGPAHMRMRDDTFEAAGVPGGDPDPRLVQERRVRRRGQRPQGQRQGRRREEILPADGPESSVDGGP